MFGKLAWVSTHVWEGKKLSAYIEITAQNISPDALRLVGRNMISVNGRLIDELRADG